MRGDNAERFWQTMMYVANTGISITSSEVLQLHEKKWSKKTITRDIRLGVKLGWLEERENNKDPHCGRRYKYVGPKALVMGRMGELWCHSCKKFKRVEEFKATKTSGTVFRVCVECGSRINKEYFKRNRKYHLMRQRREYAKKRGRKNRSRWYDAKKGKWYKRKMARQGKVKVKAKGG